MTSATTLASGARAPRGAWLAAIGLDLIRAAAEDKLFQGPGGESAGGLRRG